MREVTVREESLKQFKEGELKKEKPEYMLVEIDGAVPVKVYRHIKVLADNADFTISRLPQGGNGITITSNDAMMVRPRYSNQVDIITKGNDDR